MKTVNVEFRSESFDCDCCGFYSNDIAQVLIQSEDRVIIDTALYHDGHLGIGGDWDGTQHSLYCYLITFLNGCINYIFDGNDYTEKSGRKDLSDQTLVIRVKHDETSASVQFDKYFYLTDFQSYETKDFRDNRYSLEENLLKWALGKFCSENDIECKIINKV